PSRQAVDDGLPRWQAVQSGSAVELLPRPELLSESVPARHSRRPPVPPLLRPRALLRAARRALARTVREMDRPGAPVGVLAAPRVAHRGRERYDPPGGQVHEVPRHI